LNTNVAAWLLTVSVLLHGSGASGQSTYQVGGLPSLNLNGRLTPAWSLHFKIESRQLFGKGGAAMEPRRAYEYVLTDVSLLAARKAGLRGRFAGGYLIRREAGGTVHRFIQQYTFVQRLPRFRLAHRLACDQTISGEEKPAFRLRYRITAEIPLGGSAVDPGEFYLKVAHEYLGSRQSGESLLEARWVPVLGYDLSGAVKLESGLDYRKRPFPGMDSRSSYWWTVNLFLSLWQ
jgi:hypothetical protein